MAFLPELVRQIQAGTKNVTRRPLLAQPETRSVVARHEHGRWHRISRRELVQAPCEAGDILWVKEQTAILDGRTVYRADDNASPTQWKPSRFMRRSDARLFLHVDDVSCEMLQSITPGDVVCEGIDAHPGHEVATFAATWDRIYGKKGLGWKENPWVWRIRFHQTTPH